MELSWIQPTSHYLFRPMPMPLNIVFFGTPQFAVPSLQRLLQDDRFNVLGCVTQPDKRRGRGGKTTPSPVKAIALDHDLPVWQPPRIKKDEDTLAQLTALQADIFVVVAYGQILSTQILTMPRLGCVNGHGSLLPQYRGAAPIQWCIYDGVAETGVTTMLMDEGMDTGAMLLKAPLPVGPTDTAHDIAITMADLTAELLANTLPQLDAGQIQPQPQDDGQATYASLIKKPDYQLHWQRSALELHNQVRGFYPSCASTFRDQPIKIQATLALDAELPWPSELEGAIAAWQSAQTELPPTSQAGQVIALLKNHGPVIQTGNGPLLLLKVQPAGKKPQSGWDFVNGLRVKQGEVFTQQV